MIVANKYCNCSQNNSENCRHPAFTKFVFNSKDNPVIMTISSDGRFKQRRILGSDVVTFQNVDGKKFREVWNSSLGVNTQRLLQVTSRNGTCQEQSRSSDRVVVTTATTIDRLAQLNSKYSKHGYAKLCWLFKLSGNWCKNWNM